MTQNYNSFCKLSLFLLLSFFVSNFITAQCPVNSDVNLTTQTAVNNFGSSYPNCNQIVDLRIGEFLNSTDPIVDLSPLSGLTSITGTLKIDRCRSLLNLTGLENLTSVNELILIQNDALTSISALSGLTNSNIISVLSNESLLNLQGLEGITQTERININSQDLIMDLYGLQNLVHTDTLVLSNNDALINLSGLENLQDLDFLSIVGNDELLDLSGMDNLTFIRSFFSITNNPKLTSFFALENVDISEITTVSVRFNSSLSECVMENFCNLISTDISTFINNNGPDCVDYNHIINRCASLCSPLTPCDDGDPCTINDMFDTDCNCIGSTQNPGDSCDDGDANTSNDQIQADGCTCLGTSGPAVFDCNDIVVSNDDTSITISGLNATNSEIQLIDPDYNNSFYCYQDCNATEFISGLNAGEYELKIKVWDANFDLVCDIEIDIAITGGPCTDVDGDGVCADVDCDDNDANFPMAAGTACDDGDADTDNDQIQQDGCTCAGTPVGCTDADGDGICSDDDCDDNDANFPMTAGTACDDGDANTENDQIQSDGCTCAGTAIPTPIDCNAILISNDVNSITIDGLPTANSQIQLFDEDYNSVFYCYLDCTANTSVTGLSFGEHHLKIKVWDANNDLVCDIDLDIMIQGMGCPDVDGDGVCADVDCDDNDANFPMAAGTACDDGDADTENDQIQQDGCTCAGTPVGCADLDGDGICADDDCDDNDANFPMATGTACDDGNIDTENDQIQSDGCTCAGTPIQIPADCDDVVITTDISSISITGLTAPNVQVAIWDADNNKFYHCVGDCNISELIDNLPPNTYFIKIKFWDDAFNLICEIDTSVEVLGAPCTDADGDGVCAADDCDDNDANFPMAEGTACDDGDANTTGDVILSDGCTCSGALPNGDCDDVSIVANNNSIVISGLDIAPISFMEIYDDNWTKLFKCYDDCEATETLSNLAVGTYFVRVKLFDSNAIEICEREEYLTININSTDPFVNTNPQGTTSSNVIHTPVLKVYPNPTVKEVFIKMDRLAEKDSYLKIYNNLGKLMMTQEINGQNNIELLLNLEDYKAGLYIVNFYQSGKRMISKKLIIARD